MVDELDFFRFADLFIRFEEGTSQLPWLARSVEIGRKVPFEVKMIELAVLIAVQGLEDLFEVRLGEESGMINSCRVELMKIDATVTIQVRFLEYELPAIANEEWLVYQIVDLPVDELLSFLDKLSLRETSIQILIHRVEYLLNL